LPCSRRPKRKRWRSPEKQASAGDYSEYWLTFTNVPRAFFSLSHPFIRLIRTTLSPRSAHDYLPVATCPARPRPPDGNIAVHPGFHRLRCPLRLQWRHALPGRPHQDQILSLSQRP